MPDKTVYIGSAIAIFVIFAIVVGGLRFTGYAVNDLFDGTPCNYPGREACKFNDLYVCEDGGWSFVKDCGSDVCVVKEGFAQCLKCSSVELISSPETEDVYSQLCVYPYSFG